MSQDITETFYRPKYCCYQVLHILPDLLHSCRLLDQKYTMSDPWDPGPWWARDGLIRHDDVVLQVESVDPS